MKFKNLIRCSVIFLMSFVMSCDKQLDEQTTLTFIGDSLIARWDLQSYFSSLITYNRGLSGAGIWHVESMEGMMKGKNVVVMIGTNDYYYMNTPENRLQYEDRYMVALKGLKADKIYLYEVLPRDCDSDPEWINEAIRTFNADIAVRVAEEPDIVYIKVYDSFLGKDGRIIELYYGDRLHLSEPGYEILANSLFSKLKQ